MYIVHTRKCLEYRLKKEMKRGRLLDVSYVKRGIGKTTLLVEIARETGAIIVCPNITIAQYFNRLYHSPIFVTASESLELLNQYMCGILLEEGISPKREKEILGYCKTNILGGYSGCCKVPIFNFNRYRGGLE